MTPARRSAAAQRSEMGASLDARRLTKRRGTPDSGSVNSGSRELVQRRVVGLTGAVVDAP
ncbi:hypothetical protein C8K36_102185 [Rhodococcus sp. OK519]|uniref:hypothetical protein n=1 Tax=Rhodococcus sp. OK519 TaxID=2135729 RepID=UPI000D36C1D6|nr:hypothetical protein C8K36_102185 [Rhodococcus sp. OK519]